MSRGSWRSAEALHKRQVEKRAIRRTDERARLKREREVEEWHITGEPVFQPKERSYPHGGGVKGTAEFLGAAERAMHLYDRFEKFCRCLGTPGERVFSIHTYLHTEYPNRIHITYICRSGCQNLNL